MSKGLEFAIVFALGVISRTPMAKKIDDEIEAEKLRQLYVAFTRAKLRLYVPFVKEEENRLKVKDEYLSPLEIFVSHMDKQDLKHNLEGLPVSYLDITTTVFSEKKESKEQRKLLLEKRAFDKKFTPHIVHSFTSLTANTKKEKSKEVIEKPKWLELEVESLEKQDQESKEGLTYEQSLCMLPAGTETGVLIHYLFEKIMEEGLYYPFQQEKILHVVQKRIKNTSLEAFEKAIYQMVVDVFHQDLQGFCLLDIPPNKMVTELEFLQDKETHYVHGFADLVFEYDGKYYILDWKTNFLGYETQDYTKEKIKKAMEEGEYFLQNALYKDALKEYLTLYGLTPFDTYFGGSFYVFLRGIKQDGFYYIQ